jgi:hypothetical protein|tara:strand:- start:5930 stop:6694 length:765 start_codon:yes stop_codon:yes gene_type:complete
MKKILILGCSFTEGSYELCDLTKEKKGRKPWEAPDKYINHKGWWYFVDYFKDKDVTVVACSSLGYWAYYQLILFLNENKKLDYDEIWIQETADQYRPSIFNYKFLEKMFQTPNNVEQKHLNDLENTNFKFFQTGSIRIKENRSLKLTNDAIGTCIPEFLPYTIWDKFFIDVTYMCSEKIQLLCKKLNIKGYVWSMYESYMDCNHFTRLPLENMREHLYNKNLLTGKNHPGLHQTEEGNKYIAKLIDNACIGMKI